MTTAQHGYVMVDPNDKGAWQKLELEVPIEENGYIYIYVANESMDNVDVYFDDMEVQLIDAPLTSASDYYPFGLAMAGRSYSSEKYRFGYQGQFAEMDEETGWNAFEARSYDPVIGRWMQKFDTGWNRFTEGTVITNGITAVLSAELTGLFGLGAIGTRFFGAAGGILGATSQNVEYRITGYTKDVVEWYGIIRHNHVTGKTDFLNIGTSEPVSVIEGNVMIEYKITQQLPDGSSTSISFSEEAKVLH
jgi:RHS repeat-associated protein